MSQNPPRDERTGRRELAEVARRLHALETTPTNDLNVGGILTVIGALAVGGNAVFDADLAVAGDLDVAGGLDVAGALTALGLLAAAAGLNVTGNLNVVGDLDVNGELDVSGDGVVGGNLVVGGGLTVDGTNLALFLDPPFDTYLKGANQSIANTTATALTGMTFTASANGYHNLTGSVPWDNNPTGRREAFFRRSDGTNYEGDSRHSAYNTPLINSIAAMIPMTAGQSVSIMAWQSSGAALDVLAGARFEVCWRRPL